MIEQLTDEEQEAFDRGCCGPRIIRKVMAAHAADRAALAAQLEAAERVKDAAFAGNARATEEARQLRERLSVEEGGRSRSESLLQKTAWRLESLHVAAHAACGMWERTPSASIHDIRTSMRSLREVLNKPNLRSNPDAALVAQLAELTRERDEARGLRAGLEELVSDRSDERYGPGGGGVYVPELRALLDKHPAATDHAQVAQLTAERNALTEAVKLRDRGITDLRAHIAELTRERDEARAELANDPGHDFMLSEVTRLTEALAAAERGHDHAIGKFREAFDRAEAAESRVRELERRLDAEAQRERAAESECAALRAEVERLTSSIACVHGMRNAAESRLAAANALLEYLATHSTARDAPENGRLCRAHLAAQPATAPARAEVSKQ